jgi:hypothetical protein
MKKKILILLLLIVLCIGCGKKETNNTNTNNNQNTEEKGSNGDITKQKGITDPLPADKEGLKIVNPRSTSRPYAVMINNIGVARPLQSGLQDAYIIYEFMVEGGLTRYMALFMDQKTERIGSVRSARHYYLDYALENDAIYIHHGNSPQAKDDFSKLGVDRIEINDTKTGWRDKSLNVSTEHTLFTNIEKLNSGLGKKRTTRNKDLLLDYSNTSVSLNSKEGSKKAQTVNITYSNSSKDKYVYDIENMVYKRYVNGKEHVDYVTKKQYTFKNIIAYAVKYSRIPGDDKDRQTIDNIGKGEGYYISEGVAVPITWEKTSRSAQTIYKFKDGTPLKVNDGNTFIQIYPTKGEIKIS